MQITMDEGYQFGLGVFETIAVEDIKEMEECFVTNSLMGIMPVKSLNGITYSMGKITKMCQDFYIDALKTRRFVVT